MPRNNVYLAEKNNVMYILSINYKNVYLPNVQSFWWFRDPS